MKSFKIGMLMCLMVLAFASVSRAVIAPVTSVTVNNVAGTPSQYNLLSITVGSYTVPLADLRTGTSTGTANQGGPVYDKFVNMDSFDLNLYTARNAVAAPDNNIETVLFGGSNFTDTNGSQPDFFLFEASAAGPSPDDVGVVPIFPDGSVGTVVNLPTEGSGWGNTSLLADAGPNLGQAIVGVCWNITDMKDAAGVNLASNAVIKGIRIVPNPPAGTGGLDPCLFCAAIATKGQAHTPKPDTGDNLVDKTVTSVSWYSPLQDSSGDTKTDPNIISISGYTLWFGTVEPNELTNNTRKYVNQPGQSYSVSLDYNTAYYWRVDTHLTWNAGGFPPVVKGSVWQFKTKPQYIAPNISKFDYVRTAVNMTANLTATVTSNSLPITEVTFTLLTDDVEYPAGAIATLVDTTTDKQNPTATLTANTVGKYKVKLVVKDQANTLVEKFAEVNVYVDACAARKAIPAGSPAPYSVAWAANPFDRNNDCFVDVTDLQVFVQNWLLENAMTVQETYAKQGVYVVEEILVEAEAVYSTTDLNYVTEPPLETTAGNPRIWGNTYASGGQVIGYTAANHFVTYEINVPAAGAYTVYVMNAHPSGTTTPPRAIAFGTVSPDGIPANDEITKYGTVTLSAGTGYGDAHNYYSQYKLDSGVITFDTAGTQLVRMTWIGGAANVDFIALKKN